MLLILVVLFLAITAPSYTAATKPAVQMPLQASDGESVPGENPATYCTVSRSEQLFDIEFFDVAPLPLPVERHFFTYLRGYVADYNVTDLDKAEFRITMSVVLDSGEQDGPRTYSIPLETFARDSVAHLTIRYTSGEITAPGVEFGGKLRPGYNEILTDYWFPEFFLRSGHYTFKIEAALPSEEGEKERYLFAFQGSQHLKGRMT